MELFGVVQMQDYARILVDSF